MSNDKQAAVRDPLIGQILGGRYSMLRLIGRGGVGLVYLAEDNHKGEEVVVKLLSPDWSRKPEAVKRFEREAERLGGVRHPNIVRLLDQGVDAGRPYLAMEYLEGAQLSDYIAERRYLDLVTFVPIAAQVLKGIGHAHSRGVMIRDIKPANIMLCERKGRANFVKILDFGLAKLIGDQKPVTQEHVLGTAGYLAPEVIQGNSEIDLRVDVFSLGALFYFMLSGRLPFQGDETATVFYKTIHDDPTPLHEVLPTDHEVPEGLIKLVHACMAKDPDARPDDANAIVEQLIDVVPASMFRLPKVSPKTSQPGAPVHAADTTQPGYGNTGLVALVGEQALSGRHPVAPAAPVPAPTGGSEPITLSDPSQDPDHTGPIGAVGGSNRGLIIGLAAAVVLLGGSLAYYATSGGPDTRNDGDAKVASAGPSGAPDYDDAVARVRAHIDEGDIDAASDLLDTLRGPARELPALAGRVERLDIHITNAKLMAAGEAFEAKGETKAAVAAYRDVLATDPTHVKAREKLGALAPGEALDPASPDTTDAEYVPVDIGSRPLANLFIDGEARGTTPFVGKLSIGKHTVRMTARGYQPWQGELDVRESGTEDLRVRLVGKGRGKRSSRDTSSTREPETTSNPQTPSQPKSQPKSEPKSQPPGPAVTKKKKNPFLPTKDDSGKNGGGVFLPTKD
ncbi:MAG: serine/threonine protein kinase [Nannocystaceae bacterium]|nr:serine/threonine protein kinase [bacterium]